MLYMIETILGVLVIMAGACIFSFLNVVIYRVPRKISFVTGRSMCTDCGHALSFLDMVPVISWLCLGRRCRYCHSSISGRYALVETMGGISAGICLWHYGATIEALMMFAFYAMLTVVAFVDWDTMEIPNGFVLAILILAIIHVILQGRFPYGEYLVGMFVVSLPMLLLTMLIPGAFGGGDIKLMAVCGLFLGWKITLLSFFFAVLGGGSYGIYLLAGKKKGRRDHFPFGPFLCMGMFLGSLWGLQMWNWYLGLFGI